MDDQYSTSVKPKPTTKSIDVLLGNEARRVYDTPDKGILWGWEVSGYVFTKAISAGAVMIPLIAVLFGLAEVTTTLDFLAMGIGMSFLLLTGVLLVMDLDQPKRFLYVLLRPHWGSWLVKGGYTIALFGGLITALVLASMQDWHVVQTILRWMTLVTGVVLAIYTAFLFGQAKGRDFWQSPGLAMHMLIHSLLAGAAVFAIIALFTPSAANWLQYLRLALFILIGINLLTMIFELTSRHPTEDARITVWMITHGQYARKFYAGVIAIGTMLPLVLLIASNQPMMMAGAGLAVLAGIYITEHIWVEAPQRINLT